MNSDKQTISTITEGFGLGNLKFGLFREEVEVILGLPDEKEEFSYSEMEDDLAESWHYDDLDISLSFDEEEDWRLVTIAISSTEYTFRDFNPIGLSKDELIDKMNLLQLNDLEYEDHSTDESPAHELLASEALGINFWFDEDYLSEVQMSPLFIDDDTIKWPE